jgi:hypothetical protein
VREKPASPRRVMQSRSFIESDPAASRCSSSSACVATWGSTDVAREGGAEGAGRAVAHALGDLGDAHVATSGIVWALDPEHDGQVPSGDLRVLDG